MIIIDIFGSDDEEILLQDKEQPKTNKDTTDENNKFHKKQTRLQIININGIIVDA
jgi:hypothetical protein